MSGDTNQYGEASPPEPATQTDERAANLGWGIGLLVAGGFMAARQLGWIEDTEWLLPAVIIGLAAKHLYKAFNPR